MVGGDGRVYEGQGWNKQGTHTKDFNEKSICIAFLGNFHQTVPPDSQLHAAQQLIQIGLRSNKIDINYKLYGHRQLQPTDSPGTALYEIIATWPHHSSAESEQ